MLMHLTDGRGDRLTLTIDSAASGNVSESPLPYSVGSQVGIRYAAASRATMPVRARRRSPQGHPKAPSCMLKMQVRDVRSPLMGVSRICDIGTKVV